MMEAISSTHHQLLECPSPSEMANIRGDQAMARTVVAVAQRRSDWAQKAPRSGPNEDSLMDKKQKTIVDQ